MELVVTEQKSNGIVLQAQSACGRYRWFSLQDGYIKDTVSGRSIYQMAYLKPTGFGSDPLPDDVAEDVLNFWAALKPLVDARYEAAESERVRKEAIEVDKREALLQRMDSYMDPEDR